MLAFITGASSGLGKQFAKTLSKMGYDLIISARDEIKLNKLKEELQTEVKVIVADLRDERQILDLYEKVKDEKIDVFINNAGFGIIGEFWKSDMNTEIDMIKVNDIAMHILFKLILKNMIKRKKRGYILNVSSLSGFMPGPLMSSYYATKAYMLNLTRGVSKELEINNVPITVSVLCPGPVYTNFADRAGVEFKIKSLSSEYVVKYALDKLFKKKLVIIPGFFNKCGHVLSKISPTKLVMMVTSKIQKRKFKVKT